MISITEEDDKETVSYYLLTHRTCSAYAYMKKTKYLYSNRDNRNVPRADPVGGGRGAMVPQIVTFPIAKNCVKKLLA